MRIKENVIVLQFDALDNVIWMLNLLLMVIDCYPSQFLPRFLSC